MAWGSPGGSVTPQRSRRAPMEEDGAGLAPPHWPTPMYVRGAPRPRCFWPFRYGHPRSSENRWHPSRRS
eukprot:576867-Pyramimonas_sp.AAC.1